AETSKPTPSPGGGWVVFARSARWGQAVSCTADSNGRAGGPALAAFRFAALVLPCPKIRVGDHLTRQKSTAHHRILPRALVGRSRRRRVPCVPAASRRHGMRGGDRRRCASVRNARNSSARTGVCGAW